MPHAERSWRIETPAKTVLVVLTVLTKRATMVAVSAAALSLFTSFSADAAPSAKDRQEAQVLVGEAKKLLGAGNIEKALKKYKKANQLAPQVPVTIEIAKIQTDLGDFVQALSTLEEAVAAPAMGYHEKRAQAEAAKLRDALQLRAPKLVLEVFKPEASKVTLTIDEEESEPGEHVVNPGKHDLVAKAKGFETWRKHVQLDEGQKETVEVSMKRAGDEEGDSDGGSFAVPKWAAWTSWGFTAAAVGVGAAFGIVAIQTTNQVLADYACLDGTCPASAAADLDIAKFNGNVSTASFALGGAGLVTASVLTVLAYKKRSPSDGELADESAMIEARPLLGPGFVGVAGTF